MTEHTDAGAVGNRVAPIHTPPSERPRTEAAEWTWLIDSYDEGTAFVTDDAEDTQRPIAAGLSPDMARGIVEDHNAVVRELSRAASPSVALDASDSIAQAKFVLHRFARLHSRALADEYDRPTPPGDTTDSEEPE